MGRGHGPPDDPRSPDELIGDLARLREEQLGLWETGEAELGQFAARTAVRVITPGSDDGETLNLLSSIEHRWTAWDDSIHEARESVSAAISLVLRLVGLDPDPVRSREHVVLSVLTERRMVRREDCGIELLLQDLANPPISQIGALLVDDPTKERSKLAARLNSLPPRRTSGTRGCTQRGSCPWPP